MIGAASGSALLDLGAQAIGGRSRSTVGDVLVDVLFDALIDIDRRGRTAAIDERHALGGGRRQRVEAVDRVDRFFDSAR